MINEDTGSNVSTITAPCFFHSTPRLVGKKASVVWNYVTKTPIPGSDGKFLQQCQFCDLNRSTAPQASRWTKHLLTDHKRELSQEAYELLSGSCSSKEVVQLKKKPKTQTTLGSNLLSSAPPPAINAANAAPKRQQSIRRYASQCNTQETEDINKYVARFILESGLSANVVEHPAFKDLIQHLHPSFAGHLKGRQSIIQKFAPIIDEELKKEIEAAWDTCGMMKKTLGIEGCTNESGGKVYFLTIARGRYVMFLECVAEREVSLTAQEVATIIENTLQAAAGDKNVEDEFAGIVFDNNVNPAAGRLVKQNFPSLIVVGCCCHAADLLMEDFGKIPEIDLLIGQAQSVSKFLTSHGMPKKAYQRISLETKATMLVTYPETKFAYADKILRSIVGSDSKNTATLQMMVTESQWPSTCQGIATNVTSQFVNLVQDRSFWRKVHALRRLTGPLSQFIHHLETPGTRASWIFPLYNSLRKDINEWASGIGEFADVNALFHPETRASVKEAFEKRFLGDSIRSIESIYKPEYLLATLLDYTTADTDLIKQHPSWYEDLKDAIAELYPSDCLVEVCNAQSELMQLFAQVSHGTGVFGTEVREHKEMLAQERSAPNHASSSTNRSEMSKTISVQKLSLRHDPHIIWAIGVFATQFPCLSKIADRLLSVSTQSADIERACKVNKQLHSKARNRLTNASVARLMRCYINGKLARRFREKDGAENPHTFDVLEGLLGDSVLEMCEDSETADQPMDETREE